MEFLEFINAFLWVGSNALLAYCAFALIFFVVGYYTLFDPSATTAGRLIFRFMLSLIGIVGVVCLGVFVDPSGDRVWYLYPDDVATWRPIVRFFVNGYVAFTTTSLSIFLIRRKWFPKKTPNDSDFVKVRNTAEIPIIPRGN